MFNVLLKELRAKKGMTQAQLAKAIGVSLETLEIGRLEKASQGIPLSLHFPAFSRYQLITSWS